MASRTALRSLQRSPAFHSPQSLRTPHARNFITLPGAFGAEPTHLTETRILPYKSSSLYALISDIDSYTKFVPYCSSSTVTKWSNPDADGKKWPEEATLKVGFGGYEETFSSRLHCVPGSIVEALSGTAQTSLPASDIKHHNSASSSSNSSPSSNPNAIFKTLSTRWILKPFHYKPPPSGDPRTEKSVHDARDHTEVHLTIDFEFSNPIYAALSKAVTPKVAGVMIEAFERRARALLDGPGAGVTEKRTSGSLLGGEKMGV